MGSWRVRDDERRCQAFGENLQGRVLRRALTAALEEVLAKQGINVCSTEFGNNLGGGIFEFRLRHDAEEIYRRAGRPFISGSERSSKILLRVFCQAYGNRIVLLLAGYDKAANSRPRHQQQQIALAQKRLRRWVALRKGRS